MRILCKGRAGVVKDTTHSKTGKHGHAKVFLTVISDDGLTLQDIMPTSADVQLAPAVAAPAF
jgi:translation elongation factor P/translation initiation factor 5A